MMLTVKQPTAYGYKTVHDLPTPPSTSRPSPPPSYHETSQRLLPPIGHSHSPPTQPMATPHRGLPPPAAMALPQQLAPPAAPSHPHHPGLHGSAPPPPLPQQSQSQPGQLWSALPPPPRDWQGAEDSMKKWLQAKTEEEKTRQEEERTRQETLRLEQRKIEADMLRASLGGGIPPPMVPLVFAGMSSGGVLPQAALEWAQQYLVHGQGGHYSQLAPSHGAVSPEHQRDQSAHAQYPGQSPAPGPAAVPAQAQTGYSTQPGSPLWARSQPTSTALGRSLIGSGSMTGVNTNAPPGSSMGPHQLHGTPPDPSPSIFFHHWQPPTSQGGNGASTNRPGTPSGDIPRKRKAMGSLQVGEREQRIRSPHNATHSSSPISNSIAAHRRGHKRQRSDASWYRLSGGEQGEDEQAYYGEVSSGQVPGSAPPLRERSRSETGKHSVSSLLSTKPGDQGPTQNYVPHHGTGSLTPYYSRRRSRPGSPTELKHPS